MRILLLPSQDGSDGLTDCLRQGPLWPAAPLCTVANPCGPSPSGRLLASLLPLLPCLRPCGAPRPAGPFSQIRRQATGAWGGREKTILAISPGQKNAPHKICRKFSAFVASFATASLIPCKNLCLP